MSKKRKKQKQQQSHYDYDPPFEQEQEPEPSQPQPKVEHQKMVLEHLLDPAQVLKLVTASEAPYKDAPPEEPSPDYPTYSEEEVQALSEGRPYRRKNRHRKARS